MKSAAASRHLTTVVYLAVPLDEEETLIARYLVRSEARLWGDQFVPASRRIREGSRRAVLSATDRAPQKTLRALAHRTVSLARLAGLKLDARGFLELLDAQARPA